MRRDERWCAVLALGVGAMLTHATERFDFPTRDVLEHEVEFFERRVAHNRIEGRLCGLGEHERFEERLLAGFEIRQQRIPAARTARPRFGVAQFSSRTS